MPALPHSNGGAANSNSPQPILQPRLLIGEGQEEVVFFKALLKHLGRIDQIQIEQCSGKSKLADALEALVVRPGFSGLEALGVTRDADDPSNEDAFGLVCGALRRAGLVVPDSHGAFAEGRPRVGVFIMSGSGKGGALEDICLESIATDPAMACVESYFDCMTKCVPGPADKDRAKAKVRVWLASRERPDLALGHAAAKGYWPFEDPAFNSLKKFILNM